MTSDLISLLGTSSVTNLRQSESVRVRIVVGACRSAEVYMVYVASHVARSLAVTYLVHFEVGFR